MILLAVNCPLYQPEILKADGHRRHRLFCVEKLLTIPKMHDTIAKPLYGTVPLYGTMSNVQSVKRAISILEAIASTPAGMGVTEVAHRVDLPKTTVARLLSTLEEAQAVERLNDSHGFRIGSRLVAIASQVPYTQRLTAIARPHLLELAEATSEAVNLCCLEGDQVLYLDQVQGQYQLQIRDWTGNRLPLHVVSPGKVLLAYSSKEVRQHYLNRPLGPFTEKTITDPQLLQQQLEAIRAQGYATAHDEFEEGIVGIAAPIHDKAGQVVATVNVYGPAFRFPAQGKDETVTQLVIQTAQKIAARL